MGPSGTEFLVVWNAPADRLRELPNLPPRPPPPPGAKAFLRISPNISVFSRHIICLHKDSGCEQNEDFFPKNTLRMECLHFLKYINSEPKLKDGNLLLGTQAPFTFKIKTKSSVTALQANHKSGIFIQQDIVQNESVHLSINKNCLHSYITQFSSVYTASS